MSTELARSFNQIKNEIHQRLQEWPAILDDLEEIKARQLFKETHRSFEDFCKDEFGISRQAIYAKLTAHKVRKNIADQTIRKLGLSGKCSKVSSALYTSEDSPDKTDPLTISDRTAITIAKHSDIPEEQAAKLAELTLNPKPRKTSEPQSVPTGTVSIKQLNQVIAERDIATQTLEHLKELIRSVRQKGFQICQPPYQPYQLKSAHDLFDPIHKILDH